MSEMLVLMAACGTLWGGDMPFPGLSTDRLLPRPDGPPEVAAVGCGVLRFPSGGGMPVPGVSTMCGVPPIGSPWFPDSIPSPAWVDVGFGPAFTCEGPVSCSNALELARVCEDPDPLPAWVDSSFIVL